MEKIGQKTDCEVKECGLLNGGGEQNVVILLQNFLSFFNKNRQKWCQPKLG
jgi:hypothetical protein